MVGMADAVRMAIVANTAAAEKRGVYIILKHAVMRGCFGSD